MALARKDWRELSRTPQVLFPVFMLPIVFALLLPMMIIAIASDARLLEQATPFRDALEQLPANLADDPVRGFVLVFMAPFFLMIPVVVATVVATAAFVGEKERDTLEGLLFTPLSDLELVVGKIVATWVLAVAVTWFSAALYLGVVLGFARPWEHGWFFPTPSWVGLIFVVAPLMSFFAISCIVLISQRSSTLQGAQAVSGLLVLPVVMIIVGQSSGLMVFNASAIVVVGVLAALVDVLMAWIVARSFDRDRLVAQL